MRFRLITTLCGVCVVGPAIRYSADCDALLHLRYHWHAGKLVYRYQVNILAFCYYLL